MNVNELWIGDWYNYKGMPYKNTLRSYWYDVESDDEIITFFSECEPIHLTDEILKKFGFIDNILYIDDNHIIKYNNSNGHIIIGYLVGGEITPYIDLYIDCVHKFQQALRLCGLNEFADSLRLI